MSAGHSAGTVPAAVNQTVDVQRAAVGAAAVDADIDHVRARGDRHRPPCSNRLAYQNTAQVFITPSALRLMSPNNRSRPPMLNRRYPVPRPPRQQIGGVLAEMRPSIGPGRPAQHSITGVKKGESSSRKGIG
jgi:hypothetical protein